MTTIGTVDSQTGKEDMCVLVEEYMVVTVAYTLWIVGSQHGYNCTKEYLIFLIDVSVGLTFQVGGFLRRCKILNGYTPGTLPRKN